MPTHAHRGYARVSTADQNPDHQIDAQPRVDVDRDNIHVDTASGAKASRPKLDLVLQLLREGDSCRSPGSTGSPAPCSTW
nr:MULTISPECIES: recombinase family protein [Streptomyces]